MNQKDNLGLTSIAVWLLISAIILGLLDMVSSNSIVDASANFYISDMVAYLIFATFIFLIKIFRAFSLSKCY